MFSCYFFFNDTAPTDIYTVCHTLALHDALPISTITQYMKCGMYRMDWTTRLILSPSRLLRTSAKAMGTGNTNTIWTRLMTRVLTRALTKYLSPVKIGRAHV